MNESISRFYDRLGRSHFWLTSKYHVIDHFLTQEFLRKGGKTTRILEVGCSTGNFLHRLRSRCESTYGIDLSAEILRVCKDRWKGVSLTAADGHELPFRERSFDLVVLVDVLEHFEKADTALSQVRKVLKEDGSCLVCVPAYRWLWGANDVLFGHQLRYTRGQLASQLHRTGFELVRLTYFQPLFLPLLFLKRKLFDRGSDFRIPPPYLNSLLDRLLRLDARILQSTDLPFGCTLLGLATKSGA